MTKENYKLVWIDATVIDNIDLDKMDETNVELNKELAQRFENYRIEKIDGEWVDVEAWINFEASEGELVEAVDKVLNKAGRNIEVFSVTDKAGRVIMTEEDINN